MAKLTLQILGKTNAPGNGIDSVIQRVENNLKKIENVSVKISVDASGLEAVDKTAVKVLQAQAKIADANAKVKVSENNLAIAREKTKQSVNALATAESKLTQQMEKTATAEENARKANTQLQTQIEKTNTTQAQAALQAEKTRTEEAKLAVQEEKTATAAENRATAEAKATNATKTLGEETEKTAKKAESLWDNFQKFARWYIIGNAFSGIVRSMREALDTMREVDDELVTIRKVTGFSDSQIAGIKQQAYSTASAYGVGAADYLESVAAYSRAGYKEQAAALAELSTKTQIVGDTTAETANQFLLSVDAAYKYKGSIEQLTAVLDGANEIDNKYATSIEKIAEGMGIVAPVAEQMHVGVNELASAIGTITAVTQRTGSEAARALRALFLNIVGDTKTEIDEGVTWTTGEIAGLRDVIKEYAPEAYKAAQATGSIIDPMEAIGGLAKSMQDGLLTEQKLMEMVSDIGGKLRTSQLLALIQNWDMYQSMLQDYAGAIGSADKEVDNALDSWTRKTNQLKNAWTEFISHLIETKQIKGAIDLLTGAVKLLDSSFGKAAVTAGLLFAALKVTGAINGLITLISGLITTIGGLTTATELFSAVWAASPFMVVALGAAAIYGIVKAIDALTVTYDEQKEKLEELENQYNKTYGSGSEIDQLRKKTEQLTAIEKNRLAVLEAQEAVLKKQIEDQKKTTFQSWRAQNGEVKYSANKFGGLEVDWVSKTGKQADEAAAALRNLNKEYLAGEVSAEGYKAKVQELVVGLRDNVSVLQDAMKSGEKLTQDEYELVQVYETLTRILAESTDETKSNTAEKQDNAEATEEVAAANDTLQKALDEVDKKGSLTYGTLAELEGLYPGLTKRILDANGELTEEGRAALSTKDAFILLVGQIITFNTTGLDVSDKILQLQQLATQAGLTGSAIAGVVGSPDIQSAIEDLML